MRGLNSFICLLPLVPTFLSSLGALKHGGGAGFRILLMDEFFQGLVEMGLCALDSGAYNVIYS